jgi:diguanylate cyclase (GGDEF)-like protein
LDDWVVNKTGSRTDPLTKLSNRRDMLEKIEFERIRFERSKRPFVFILCDIDKFKNFNDEYGHKTGDFVLVSIAKLMLETMRKQDQVCRWGGEEFLLLLPETEFEGGGILAEKELVSTDLSAILTHAIKRNPSTLPGSTLSSRNFLRIES